MAHTKSAVKTAVEDKYRELIKDGIIDFSKYHPTISKELKRQYTELCNEVVDDILPNLLKSYKYFKIGYYTKHIKRDRARQLLMLIGTTKTPLYSPFLKSANSVRFRLTSPLESIRSGYYIPNSELPNDYRTKWNRNSEYMDFYRSGIWTPTVPRDIKDWLDDYCKRNMSYYPNMIAVLSRGYTYKTQLFKTKSTKFKVDFTIMKYGKKYHIKRQINGDSDMVRISRDMAFKLIRHIKWRVDLKQNDIYVTKTINKAFIIGKWLRDGTLFHIGDGGIMPCSKCKWDGETNFKFHKLGKLWYANRVCAKCGLVLSLGISPLFEGRYTNSQLHKELYSSHITKISDCGVIAH